MPIRDADLAYDPREYPRLIRPFLDDRARVVYGSRFIGGDVHRVLFFWHSVANRVLTLVSNMFTNVSLLGVGVYYKAFRREVLEQLSLKEDRFGFEPGITAKVAEVPGLRRYGVGISHL